MLAYDKRNTGLYFFLFVAVLLNVTIWCYSNKIYVKWGNVPPVPKQNSLIISFLGDKEFAFRASAMALQNYGNVGEAQSLNKYNFKTLGDWFNLLNNLNSKSSYVPYLAAYYFGGVQDGKKLGPVVSYLEKVGMQPGDRNWRWMAEAAYLARHRMNDMDNALRISRELATLYKPGMPLWTLNMVPMLTANMGDKQAAYLLMLEILKSDGPKMTADEYKANIGLTCQTILTPEQAKTNPLCQK